MAEAAVVRLSHDYGRRLRPGERALGPYAASAVESRGRVHAEPACPTRSPLQRDRDRILHSTAFRRLIYKTQVFVFHEGDHYRTRLTHSLEVAQIARTIARQLCLDEDLAEAISLAHDLGHPPFGHSGERALDRVLALTGGFDHNVQSFRLVTRLERKYAEFDGLNLSFETLEGIAKHNGPPANSVKPGDVALVHAVTRFEARMPLELDRQPSAEAQVAAIADDIAWCTHDIDDGLRAGLIDQDGLAELALIAPLIARLRSRPSRDSSRDSYEISRQLITRIIADAVAESRDRLAGLAPDGPDQIRGAGAAVVGFSPAMARDLDQLRQFLHANLYRHPSVMQTMERAAGIVTDLVERYQQAPEEMLGAWRAAERGLDSGKRLRLIGDFVAGMTDRFAIAEHRRLFDAARELR